MHRNLYQAMKHHVSEENKYYISALFDHIDDAFQNGNIEVAEKIRGFIAQRIPIGREINDTMFPMRGPFSKLAEGLIVLQAGFLSYLWTVCYFMIGLIEIYADKAGTNQPVVSLVNSEKFPLLNYTFAWGRSLKPAYDEEFVPWPDDIANPMQPETRPRQANHLCVLATSYLMYHELGHLIRHSDCAEFIKSTMAWGYEPNDDDSRRLRMMEIQADDFAIECMFVSSDDEHTRYMKYLAAIIAHLAEFFLRKHPDARAKNYPDLDERLIKVINKVDIIDPAFKMNIDMACTIGLQLFLTLTYAEYIQPVTDQFAFENFDDLKSYLFKIIAAWKEKYSLSA